MNSLTSAKSLILIYSLVHLESSTLRKPNFIYFTHGTASVFEVEVCKKGGRFAKLLLDFVMCLLSESLPVPSPSPQPKKATPSLRCCHQKCHGLNNTHL